MLFSFPSSCLAPLVKALRLTHYVGQFSWTLPGTHNGNKEAFVAVIPESARIVMIGLVGGCAVFIRRLFAV